jgi:diketogulonate reductase-like aldo/keto reductase
MDDTMDDTTTQPLAHIAFGVYRLNDPAICELAVRQAIDAGVSLIDTARKRSPCMRRARTHSDVP